MTLDKKSNLETCLNTFGMVTSLLDFLIMGLYIESKREAIVLFMLYKL